MVKFGKDKAPKRRKLPMTSDKACADARKLERGKKYDEALALYRKGIELDTSIPVDLSEP